MEDVRYVEAAVISAVERHTHAVDLVLVVIDSW